MGYYNYINDGLPVGFKSFIIDIPESLGVPYTSAGFQGQCHQMFSLVRHLSSLAGHDGNPIYVTSQGHSQESLKPPCLVEKIETYANITA